MLSNKQNILLLGSTFTIMMLSLCCGLNNWVEEGDVTVGLWEKCDFGKCVTLSNNVSALHFEKIPDWFQAVRGLVVASVITAVGGLVLAVLSVASKGVSRFWASRILTVSAMCMISGLSTFVGCANLSSYTFGFGFIIGCVGVGISLLTALVGLFAVPSNKRYQRFVVIVEEEQQVEH